MMKNQNSSKSASNKKKKNRNAQKKKDNSYSFLNFSNSGGVLNKTGIGRTVAAPTASGRILTTEKPRFSSRGDSTIVRHSEFVSDVVQKIAFNSNVFEINPGISDTFPWLSGPSLSYEKYKFVGLNFRYEVLSSTNTTGKVFFVPDFNMQEEGPLTKQAALSYELATGSQPWVRFSFSVPDKYLRAYNEYFIRNFTLPSNADIKTYDPLRLYVATEGATVDNTIVGELWVDYAVELINPLSRPNMVQPVDLLNNTVYVTTSDVDLGYAPFGVVSRSVQGKGPFTFSGNQVSFTEDWVGMMSLYMHTPGSLPDSSYNWGPTITDVVGVTDWNGDVLFNFPLHSTLVATSGGSTYEQYMEAKCLIISRAGGSFKIHPLVLNTYTDTYFDSAIIVMTPGWISPMEPIIPMRESLTTKGKFILPNMGVAKVTNVVGKVSRSNSNKIINSDY